MFCELAGDVSGGTLNTVRHHLFKKKDKKKKPAEGEAEAFDPMLTDRNAKKSSSSTKVALYKRSEYVKEFDMQAEDWIMSAVMGNCVRRSNALCNYTSDSAELLYRDGRLENAGVLSRTGRWFGGLRYKVGFGLEMVGLPNMGLVPKPGKGPSRQVMMEGYLKLHGRAVTKDGRKLKSLFTTARDPGYMDTAKMLVCSGLLLLNKTHQVGGVVTPAFAFGQAIVNVLEKETGATFSVELQTDADTV